MKKKENAIRSPVTSESPQVPLEDSFQEVLTLIQAAKQRAYQAVNSELVTLYWQVGEYISCKPETAEWGDGVVDELASFLAQKQPGLSGFTRRNLFRMRQFYEAYRGSEIVSPLVTQLPWTHCAPPKTPKSSSIVSVVPSLRPRSPNMKPCCLTKHF